MEFTLNSPMTEEDLDKIYDVDMDNTSAVTFHTKHGKEVEFVKVVRCKDCVHYMPYDWMFSEVWQSQNIEDYPQNEIGCEWVDHYVKPDDYCSLGERKDGEQND